MHDKSDGARAVDELPEAVLEPDSKFSIVWLIPIIALLVGAWLAYKTWSELGPTITISFKTAEGLEAAKTSVRYKNVEIGKVETIALSEDLSHVVLTANLVKGAEKYLNTNTRFWVVKAHITGGQVSGLGTLLSGAYIGIDPGKEGGSSREFTGLEVPPVVTQDLPGKHFKLISAGFGSIDIGAPIYYRKIKAGQVIGRRLNDDGRSVEIKIFVNDPYDRWVSRNSRFWAASGLDFSIDANGISVNTESFVTLMIGGIAFDTIGRRDTQIPAEDGDEFFLYESRKAIAQHAFPVKYEYVLYFARSVRGLSVGAPVELRGIQLGEVTDIQMEIDPETDEINIPVSISLAPAMFGAKEVPTIRYSDAERKALLNRLVERGLRARLSTGSYLTGQLFVELDFYADTTAAQIAWNTMPPIFPTIPTPLEEITASVSSILKRLEKFPFETVGVQLQKTLQDLSEILAQTKQFSSDLNHSVVPELVGSLKQTQNTLAALEDTLSSDSPVSQELNAVLHEVSKAAKSINLMADYLQRHPDALIYGKGGRK